jgi:hypothetical protein
MKARPLSRIGKIFADGRRIDQALRLAVRDAIREHARYDAPVVIWRDGAIAWVPAGDLVLKSSRQAAARQRPTKRNR